MGSDRSEFFPNCRESAELYAELVRLTERRKVTRPPTGARTGLDIVRERATATTPGLAAVMSVTDFLELAAAPLNA